MFASVISILSANGPHLKGSRRLKAHWSSFQVSKIMKVPEKIKRFNRASCLSLFSCTLTIQRFCCIHQCCSYCRRWNAYKIYQVVIIKRMFITMEFSFGASLLPGLPALILPVVLDRIYQHFTLEYHSSTGTIKTFQIALSFCYFVISKLAKPYMWYTPLWSYIFKCLSTTCSTH